MSSAAQRIDIPEDAELPATGPVAPRELKQAVAERLAAHRQRRAQEHASEVEAEARALARAEAARKASRRGAATVREAVAARYQQSQSYREFLAAEAERALQQAQAEAEVAARNAAAVAEVQQQLMAEIAEWSEPKAPQLVRTETPASSEARGELAHALADIVLGARELIAEPPSLTISEAHSAPGLTVKLYEDIAPLPSAPAARKTVLSEPTEELGPLDEELSQLEQEIEFRRAPEFAAPHVIEAQTIAANIIEFPRQLIAPRKARPRIAEGPLREESAPEPQLRIFEVEAEQIVSAPAGESSSSAPDWQSMMLESSTPAPQHVAPFDAQAHFTFQPQTAPNSRRLASAVVDLACVATAFAAFTATVGHFAGPSVLHAVKLPVLAGCGVAVLFFFALAYQVLFFTFSEQTPGMKAARIALCTFGDDYPTRKAMRRRIFAMVLAACPLGLGFAWIWMDNDRLGWHDRISRMYQRAY